MEDKITRRMFMKRTMCAGSALVIFPDFEPGFNLPDNCVNCGVNGKELTSSTSFHLLKKRFCPNCGIDLYSITYPVDATCNCSNPSTGEPTISEKQKHPPCCQVPFPGTALAGSTYKPIFSVADLNF